MDIKNMDVNILLSIVNTKLRDNYSSLEDLCEDMDISKDELLQKLKSGDFEYNKQENSFR